VVEAGVAPCSGLDQATAPRRLACRGAGASTPASARIITELSWPLLVWTGLAATLLASIAGAGPGILIGTRLSRKHRVRRHFGRFMLAVVLGVVVYPAAYGAVFEVLSRADLMMGLALGGAHGAIAVLWRVLRPPTGRDTPAPLRLLAGHLLYGAALGIFYIVPHG
jgi:hypothetical protein